MACAIASSAPGAQDPADPNLVVSDSTLIIGNGTPGPYWLSGYFILRGSENVLQHAQSLDSSLYEIDGNRGRIRFAADVTSGDSVLVRFQRLTWALPTEWQFSSATGSPKAEPQIQPVAFREREYLPPPSPLTSPRRSDPGSNLKWQGFKSFSVTTSSTRGADWSQGLELAVNGELTSGLTLDAGLSDRFADATQSSIRRDGTRVGDLEQFHIEARSQKFQGRMGDFTLPGAATQHAAGALASWQGETHKVNAYIGRAEGQTVRRSISVSPRIAGPYDLAPFSTAHPIPGTIVLWLDGQRLVEGTDRDYTYDPASGSITLSPAVTPTVAATLIAEFEQTLNEYRRALAGFSWSWDDPRVSHDIRARWEGDDPSRPIFGELSAAERAILSQTPGGEVTVASPEYRGEAHGDYRLDVDGADSVFTYVGPDIGDWRVTFEYTGPGAGRYRHLAEAAYEYVGPGLGAYEPVATLGAPRASLTLQESLALRPPGMGQFQGRVLAHLDDPNRLSVNSSTAELDHHLSWSSTAGHDQLRVDWRRQRSTAERTPEAIDHLNRFASEWGLRSRYFDSARDEFGAAVSSSPDRRLSARAAGGLMQLGAVDASRLDVETNATPTPRLSIHSAYQRVETRNIFLGPAIRGETTRKTVNSLIDLGPMNGTLGWNETDLSDPAHDFEPRSHYTSSRRLGLERSGASLEYRWDRARDSSITPLRRARSLTLTVPLKLLHAGEGRAIATRGQESYDNGPYTPFYSGQLDGTWSPVSAVQLTADWSLAHTRSGVQREVYLPTRPGEGQYRLERGEYIPDINGDYRRVLATDELPSISAYDGRQQLIVSWRPVWAGWRWTVESRNQRIARHNPASFRPVQWLAPWTPASWAPAPGSRGERHGYHRVNARHPGGTEATLDYDLTHATQSESAVRDLRDRIGGALRHPLPANWFLEGRVEWETRFRTGTAVATVDATARTWRGTLGGAPRPGLSTSLEGRHRTDHDRATGRTVRLMGLRPRAQLSSGAFGLNVDTDCAWVSTPDDQATFSALLAEGRPMGFSLQENIEARWQLPGRVTLRSRLSADVRESGADRWRWELETIARF
ncbi:MAG: hypothetical protein AB1752_10515 [Candidatus Zixiibacteriota bacterium]